VDDDDLKIEDHADPTDKINVKVDPKETRCNSMAYNMV
jgi:hypothetical protein